MYTDLSKLPCELPYNARLYATAPTEAYPLKNGETTYYMCKAQACLPPVNRLEQLEQA
ncbi:MAG: hypothetical protein PHO41_00940 [Eubacteriales bacterium]|nr:hypothetical protein [Eubacteriales bacterium]